MKTSHNRILFITQWQFGDPLVQTYTLPYVQIIKRITSSYAYVVTISKRRNSIVVQKRGEIISIEIPSGNRFLFLGWIANILGLQKIIKKKSIKIVHPWCTTAGAIGAILKILNNNLTLNIDSFEPHAEAMVENKTWKKSGLKYKILFYFERIETMAADYLIFAAPGMEKYIYEKYRIHITEYSVKPACIDLEAFSFNYIKNIELIEKHSLKDKIVCVYAGKLGGIYLEDEVFEFIKACEQFWGKDKFTFLLLSNISDEYLNQKNVAFNIPDSTVLKLFIPHEQMPLYLGLADFAICPVKSVPTKKYCTPIKDGEYWAMGLPVVITPDISIDSQIVKENNAGAILESLDEKGYTTAIRQIDEIINRKSRTEVYFKIRPLAEKYRNFEIADGIYQKIYASS